MAIENTVFLCQAVLKRSLDFDVLFIKSIEDIALELREEIKCASETLSEFLEGGCHLLETICLAGFNECDDLVYVWRNSILNVRLNERKLLCVVVRPASNTKELSLIEADIQNRVTPYVNKIIALIESSQTDGLK
jgi:hypothetical protein